MAICCPKTFTGFCLEDNTPIAITIDNGVLISWTNLVTGVVTPGNPPAGTGICEVPSTVTVEIAPLTCVKDAVTVCQGTIPWEVDGTVELGATTLAALETVTVLQGTSPWTVDGIVALDAATLAALETITVLQGTSPWVVSGTVSVTEPVTVDAVDFDIRNLDCVTDSVTICPGLDPIVVNQGTSPWVISGTVSVTEPVSVDDNGGSLTTDNPDIPDLTGTWAYEAGVSGTEIIGAGRRVIGIAAHAGILAGSMTINGGDVIPVPANSSITINPYGQLVAPTITFTSTDSYFIETLI